VLEHHRGALAPQRGERLGVAAAVQVGAIVPDLGADRRGCLLVGDVEADPLAQLGAQVRAGPLEVHQRAERVQQHRSGRGHSRSIDAWPAVETTPRRRARRAAHQPLVRRSPAGVWRRARRRY
jgi:hypothetical protein